MEQSRGIGPCGPRGGISKADPDAVLCGPTAAAIHLEQSLPAVVWVASPRYHRPLVGMRFEKRQLLPELIVPASVAIARTIYRVAVTCPSTTAVDLAASDDGNLIDAMLRARVVDSDLLQAVARLTPGRRGNVMRRQVIEESRSEPWSHAERLAHRLLRQAGIAGWRANQPILLEGKTYYGDITFDRARLVVEIDGREHHTSYAAFEHDRIRQNHLVLHGWRPLRYTWSRLITEPDAVVDEIRRALDSAD